MELKEAARRVHLQRSIAFFGAGFSRAALNYNGKSLADGGEFAEELSKAAGEEEVLPLRLAAQLYEQKQCRPDNASHDYYVAREQISNAAKSLDSGPMRVLLHSKLGNGKTCGLVEFAHYCLAEGRRVLAFNGDPDGLPHDIDYITGLGSAEQGKLVVFFEHCFSYASQIKYLIERFPMVSVVLTTRSAALQTRVGDLTDAFGEDFEVYDLEGLTEDEARDFDEILYANGLWGTIHTKSRITTRSFSCYPARRLITGMTTSMPYLKRTRFYSGK